MNMQTDFSALCHRCGTRFRWRGTMLHMPPCPRCGQCLPDEEKPLAQLQVETAARQNALDRLRRLPC